MAIVKNNAAAKPAQTTTTATNVVNENQLGQFMAKLVSVNSDLKTNKNRKEYAQCVIELTNDAGETTTQPAIIYKKNLDYGMEAGNSYLTTLTIGDNGVAYLQMSHLQASQRVKVSELLDFGIAGFTRTTTVTRTVQTAAEARAAIEAQLAAL